LLIAKDIAIKLLIRNNICNMGHKFCPTCGELYHKNGKCKDGENIDELFDQYSKKYKLKKCPYCQIVTLKNGGCNHITCLYCGKNWCWLCNELFETTEEHYGNIKSKCYNRMYPNNLNNGNNYLEICSKCRNETNNYKIFYKCGHIICNNCLENHLLENNFLLIFSSKTMQCLNPDCNQFNLSFGNYWIRFIKESNNENLIKKYRPQILINEYFILPFYPNEYENYLKMVADLIGFIADNCCTKCIKCCTECGNWLDKNLIFLVLCIILTILGLIIYITVFCIFPHFVIKKLYYFKFFEEIREHNNKILLILIILGEEILFLILIFPLMIIHYIYTILILPIFGLIFCIRNKIYDNNI